MANQPFTVDVIESRFFNQRVKAAKVICQQCGVQEFGEVTIPAPAGVTLDPVTGELSVPVTLEQAGPPQVRTVTILPGKVIDQGVVPVNVLVNNLVVIQGLEIPFEGIVECPGVLAGDIVQKHDFQVLGFSITPVQGLPVGGIAPLNLVLKVVVEFCLVVTSERILKVNTAETFC